MSEVKVIITNCHVEHMKHAFEMLDREICLSKIREKEMKRTKRVRSEKGFSLRHIV